MFNEAAADVTQTDVEERDSLLGGFSGGVKERPKPLRGAPGGR